MWDDDDDDAMIETMMTIKMKTVRGICVVMCVGVCEGLKRGKKGTILWP